MEDKRITGALYDTWMRCGDDMFAGDFEKTFTWEEVFEFCCDLMGIFYREEQEALLALPRDKQDELGRKAFTCDVYFY